MTQFVWVTLVAGSKRVLINFALVMEIEPVKGGSLLLYADTSLAVQESAGEILQALADAGVRS